jgi:mannose-6-phosphate isomerase-like protein (cupin superfamily)
MTVSSKENAEHYIWGGKCDGWHLVKSKNLSVIQERVPSGCAEVRHYHNKAEQFFYVLSGIATLEVDGEIHRINPSQGLHIPAGKPHKLSNQNKEDLVFFVVSSPPSHGDRIEA